MKKEVITLPGYKMCEYLLVLQPHEDLCNKIINVRQQFAENYEMPFVTWSKPQLTLLSFTQMKMMEERIVTRLKTIATIQKAISIELKDFGSLPSHTIYINVETTVAIKQLVKDLKGAQSLMKSDLQKPHFMENFYITVAKNLLPWQYEKGWLELSNTNFSGKFMAHRMLLLQRYEGDKTYKPLQKFDFLNKQFTTTQGNLFA